MSALLSSLDILSVICGFLSTPQEILCCLSHLNRPIAQQVRPVCFSSQALLIPNHRVLLALLDRRRRRVVPTAFADTLACLGAVHSLAIRCEPRSADESKACEGALVKWCDLTSQSANSTSSFLFASLSSLSIRCLPHPPLRLTRRSLFPQLFKLVGHGLLSDLVQRLSLQQLALNIAEFQYTLAVLARGMLQSADVKSSLVGRTGVGVCWWGSVNTCSSTA